MHEGEPFPPFERFRVLSQRGHGAQGVVYEVVDLQRDLRVALKTLNLRKPEDVLRFKHEFRIVRDLHHPNLVRLGELLQDAGRWFYTMELVNGEDLLTYVRPGAVKEPRGDVAAATVTSQRKSGQSDSEPETASGPTVSSIPPTVSSATVELKMVPETAASSGAVSSDPGWVAERGRLDEGRLRKSLRSLASVVSCLHRAGKVHRDLKPSNILVDERGRLVLIDFGVSGELAEQQDDRGMMLGTVLYMAPEQTRGEQIGPEADWYALGVLIFQALTGKRPFEGKQQDVILRKTALEAPRPSELVPGVPADLDELCARLLERDPARRPQEPEILRALGVDAADASDAGFGSPMLFVGRATELALLGDAFVNVRSGRPTNIVLEGESGAGKSAIAARFIEEARAIDPRVLVLRGRCHEQERVPYNAFDAAVDAVARHLRGLPEARRAQLVPPMIEALQRTFPSLKVLARTGDEVDPQWDGRTLRRHAFAALRELLVRIAQKRPVVLLLDDLQWADADSIALIAELVRPPNAPALLLLATARPDARGASCPAVESLGTAIRRVPVRGLEPAEAAELVRRCADLHGLASSAATAAILDETRGHPMFIDELVRHLAAASEADATSTVALDEALWRRSQALGNTTRDLLHLVATAGAQVPQRLLAEAAGIAPSALAEPIAELRDGRFVRVSGVRPEDGIEPYHDRVRESVLAHLSAETRRDCHGRLARALTSSGAADPEALALHWRGAGDSVEAARWAERAADRAADALAFERAAELYRLALVGRADTDSGTLSLRIRLADALARAGRGREAAEAYLAASLLSEGDVSLALQHRAAEQLLYSGRIDDGLKLLRPVLAQNGMPMPSSKAGTLLSLLSMRARMRLRGDGFEERAASEIDPERLRRLDEVYSIALGLCWVDVMPGLVYQARHFLLALDAGEPYRASCALSLEAGVVATMKKMQRAELMLARADELADRSAQPRAKAMVMGVRGFVALSAGRFKEALGHFETARTLLRERCHGVAWEIATCETNLLFCLMLLGRFRELRERGHQWARDAEERGNLFAVASLYAGPMPVSKLGEDDPDGADRLIEGAMARWSQQGFHLQHVYQLVARTRVALYRGDPASAHALHVAAAEKLGRSMLMRVQIVRLMVNDARARAAVSLAGITSERRHELRREARKFAGRLADEGVSYASLNAAIVRAGLASQEGDRAGTETYLREALRCAEEAHMKLYAAAMRWRLGELRGGDAGRTVVATARAEFEKEGVVDCERLASSFTPGFSPLRAD